MTDRVRITFIDAHGTVSFGSAGHVLKMMASVCARSPRSFAEALEWLSPLDPDAAHSIRTGLDLFDEFVISDDRETITAWLASNDPTTGLPIRLCDSRFREYTLAPLPLGVVLFNLPDRRIVQIENRYGSILRRDQGRLRRNGQPLRQVYRYELSDDWSLLP